MSSAARDIATHLEGVSSLALTELTDLFVNEAPMDINNIVSVHDSPGEAPEANYSYERPGVQVRIRNTDYSVGFALAQDIMDELNGVSDTTISLHRYVHILASTSVLPLGRDDKRRSLFSINLNVHRTAT